MPPLPDQIRTASRDIPFESLVSLLNEDEICVCPADATRALGFSCSGGRPRLQPIRNLLLGYGGQFSRRSSRKLVEAAVVIEPDQTAKIA